MIWSVVTKMAKYAPISIANVNAIAPAILTQPKLMKSTKISVKEFYTESLIVILIGKCALAISKVILEMADTKSTIPQDININK